MCTVSRQCLYSTQRILYTSSNQSSIHHVGIYVIFMKKLYTISNQHDSSVVRRIPKNALPFQNEPKQVSGFDVAFVRFSSRSHCLSWSIPIVLCDILPHLRIVNIVLPKCRPKSNTTWYRMTTMIQEYPYTPTKHFNMALHSKLR